MCRHQVQEQACLVLEENQVVLSQLDIQQKKLREAQRNHSLEGKNYFLGNQIIHIIVLASDTRFAIRNSQQQLLAKYEHVNQG